MFLILIISRITVNTFLQFLDTVRQKMAKNGENVATFRFTFKFYFTPIVIKQAAHFVSCSHVGYSGHFLKLDDMKYDFLLCYITAVT